MRFKSGNVATPRPRSFPKSPQTADFTPARETPTSVVNVVSTLAPEAAPTTTIATVLSPTTVARPDTTTSSTAPAPVPTTATTLAGVVSLEAGLYCRDLNAMGYSYADAVAYWVAQGQPPRMDVDTNSIPCETVFTSSDVLAFWGDPLPTTTIVDEPFRVGTPTYNPDPVRGSGGFFGSGCSPGYASLPDGVWFGQLSSLSPSSAVFDLMCFSDGPEGPGTITNTNPALRDVAVSPEAAVYMVDDEGGWTLVSYGGWTHAPASGFCAGGCLEWIYINGGEITEIVELWFP